MLVVLVELVELVDEVELVLDDEPIKSLIELALIIGSNRMILLDEVLVVVVVDVVDVVVVVVVVLVVEANYQILIK